MKCRCRERNAVVNSNNDSDSRLINRFVESWAKLDDLWQFEGVDPVAYQLRCEEPDATGGFRWRPLKLEALRSSLVAVYASLPATFPPLFEQLVLGYRWAEVDLARFRLLANPPGSDLSGLGAEIHEDRGLAACLLAHGFIQFGRAPGANYDPICFDTRKTRADGDYRIVQLDHEAALCRSRNREIGEIAPTFRSLVSSTIQDAWMVPARPPRSHP
jgi:hypothetical protein